LVVFREVEPISPENKKNLVHQKEKEETNLKRDPEATNSTIAGIFPARLKPFKNVCARVPLFNDTLEQQITQKYQVETNLRYIQRRFGRRGIIARMDTSFFCQCTDVRGKYQKED
jgi:hypothetical protein